MACQRNSPGVLTRIYGRCCAAARCAAQKLIAAVSGGLVVLVDEAAE
jgi:hypothetical protein